MGGRVLSFIAGLVHLIRYRFLLFAGLLPFGLGQAIAWRETSSFQLSSFLIALAGIAFALVGVETFNEYFDAKMGTDRVFILNQQAVRPSTLVVGICGFAAAAVVMVVLTTKLGWVVVVFAIAGFMAAGFYVTPPVKLAYRGLGELAILISYGPMMTAGSYFVQAQRVDAAPFVASIVPALLILSVTVTNQIPDFFADRIVGKRNITVRLGRRRSIAISEMASLACFIFIVCGVLGELLPGYAWLALLPLPLVIRSSFLGRRHFENPQAFIPVIRGAVQTYSIAVTLLTGSYLL